MASPGDALAYILCMRQRRKRGSTLRDHEGLSCAAGQIGIGSQVLNLKLPAVYPASIGIGRLGICLPYGRSNLAQHPTAGRPPTYANTVET